MTDGATADAAGSEGAAAARERWVPGRRVQRLRDSHSYGFVLLLILASFFFTALGPADASWAPSVLVLIQCTTLAVALWTSGLGRKAVLPSVVLAVIGIVVALVQVLSDSDAVLGSGRILNAVLLLAVGVVLALGVFDQATVNGQSILGAICIYLLLGMLFTFVYGGVALFGSDAFFSSGIDGDPSLHLYFSYVTLATVGYGDYTASSDLGHTLAVIETLMGQLYLVTVVAVVVGRVLGAGRPRDP